ncbi:MAG: hypothetical protein ACJ76V_00045 [Thermoleophilaceae bacterium]
MGVAVVALKLRRLVVAVGGALVSFSLALVQLARLAGRRAFGLLPRLPSSFKSLARPALRSEPAFLGDLRELIVARHAGIVAPPEILSGGETQPP